MKIKEFEKKHSVILIPKKQSRFMKLVSRVLGKTFMDEFWTTYRLPGELPTITFPDVNDLTKYDQIPSWAWPVLEHELIHAEDMRSTWGLIKSAFLVSIFPLPVLFSGRWFIERYAYLHGIIKYGDDVDAVVESLWSGYGFPWPKSLMRKWFNKKLEEHKEKEL